MRVRTALHRGRTVTAIGFWIGALLPFVYLPLFVTGVNTPTRMLLFVVLTVVNVVALVVGHDYRTPRSR